MSPLGLGQVLEFGVLADPTDESADVSFFVAEGAVQLGGCGDFVGCVAQAESDAELGEDDVELAFLDGLLEGHRFFFLNFCFWFER